MDSTITLSQKVQLLNEICVAKFGCTIHKLTLDYHTEQLLSNLAAKVE
jgi:hypothetical protein